MSHFDGHPVHIYALWRFTSPTLKFGVSLAVAWGEINKNESHVECHPSNGTEETFWFSFWARPNGNYMELLKLWHHSNNQCVLLPAKVDSDIGTSSKTAKDMVTQVQAQVTSMAKDTSKSETWLLARCFVGNMGGVGYQDTSLCFCWRVLDKMICILYTMHSEIFETVLCNGWLCVYT